MPTPELHVAAAAAPVAALAPVLAQIRAEMAVPDAFPAPVLAAAEEVARAGGVPPPGTGGASTSEDARHLDLVTIDPEGSRDLDQAYAGERRPGGGYRVHYAIADVAWFVAPGGALDVEAHARGVTRYQPDRRTSLYPEVISQGAASLLPDQDRRALLWSIDLDEDAMPTGSVAFRRAVVRSRHALSYATVQAALDAARADDSLVVLREVGQRREAREADRGGVSLPLPAQEVILDADGRPTLVYEAPLAVEGWNAQISLLAGIVAAGIMLDGRVGLLRTLPPPEPKALEDLRASAEALGVAWPREVTYADFVRGLDPARTIDAALLHLAARTLRGAGYTAFDGEVPADPAHAAVASPYAHVTAPLRRLADRHANEVVLALVAGVEVPDWARAALVELPATMASATRKEKALERAIVDGAEAVVLAGRIGDTFEATVVAVDDKRGSSIVQVTEPAIVGPLDSRQPIGARIAVRVAEADPVARRIRFERAGS